MLGITDLDIKSDSQVVVQDVSKNHIPNWKYIHILRKCQDMWRDSFEIKLPSANLVWWHIGVRIGRTRTRVGKNASRSRTSLPPYDMLSRWIGSEYGTTDRDLFVFLQLFTVFGLLGHVSLYHSSGHSFPCIGPQGF